MVVEGAFPALGAVAKISRHLVGYLACLIVVAPYIGGAANTLATGLAEAHSGVIVGVLKKVDNTEYSSVSLWSGIISRRSQSGILVTTSMRMGERAMLSYT